MPLRTTVIETHSSTDVDRVPLAGDLPTLVYVAHLLMHRVASRLAHDVAEKKESHGAANITARRKARPLP